MKPKDITLIIITIIFFLPFFLSAPVYDFYMSFNKEHGMVMSFIKFGLLATFGESIGLRIKTGDYYKPGFGLIPRAVMWGFLGLAINMAFIIFSKGTPIFLEYLGLQNVIASFQSAEFTSTRIFTAFAISVCMNLIFAPVMMTLHKITDMHIEQHNGALISLIKPIQFSKIFPAINWRVQWNFVFKKTIPFFWIPAHTITFLLAPELRVLFAAVLGIALGVILSIASILSRND